MSLLQRHSLLRVYGITFERMGVPNGAAAVMPLAHLDSRYPNSSGTFNRELATLLYDLAAPQLTEHTLTVLARTPSMMRQFHYLRLILRCGIADFSVTQRDQLAAALDPQELRAIAGRPYADQQRMFSLLIEQLGIDPAVPDRPLSRPVVKEWEIDDLLPSITPASLAAANRENGRAVFRLARCANCHRIGNTGGVLGPKLNGLTGRFRPREILENIVLPSKVISDQYRATVFIKEHGMQITGQIVNLGGQGS